MNKKKSKTLVSGVILGISIFIFILCGGCFALFSVGAMLPPVDSKSSTPFSPCMDTPPMLQIVNSTKTMTDAQRNEYNNSLIGTCINNWSGIVTDVDEGEIFGGFTVYVDILSVNQLGSDIYLNVSREIALSITKNDTIIFSGLVSGVSDVFGETIFIDNPTIK